MELVAVVLLLGIVTAITMNRLNYLDRRTAIDNTIADNTRMIQTAVERYRFDNGTFPTDITALVTNQYLPKAPKASEPGKSYSITAEGIVEYK